MAITTSDDPIIIEVIEKHASTVPAEAELTEELKNQTARMLETCFEDRREDVLKTATRTFTESIVHLHKLLCLQEGVYHSQWPEEPEAPEREGEIAEKRQEINDTVEQYLQRQVRRYITFAG